MKTKPSALYAALHYLSYRSRTRSEMEAYLTRKQYPANEIHEAMSKLKTYGYIDDEDYVRRVSDGVHQHPTKGRNSLPGKLIRKGISQELVMQTLENYDETADEAKAFRFGHQQMMNSLSQPWRKCVDSLYRKLISRGFTSDVIQQVIQRLASDTELQSAREAAEDEQFQQALATAEKTFLRWQHQEPSRSKLRQRMLQSLYQRGYEGEMAHRAVEASMKTHDTD